MVHGIPYVDQLYDTCVVTKLKHRPFPHQASYHATEQLELVHGDLYGPVSPATPRDCRYFLLLIDDATRYMWAMLLNSKAAATDAIKRHQAATEKECGRKLRVLRTDNSGEFTTVEFTANCANERIQHHYSAPYSPQQNSVVEHRIQTVVVAARTLLK